ncbi:MAG: VWA domain-containing protein [Cyanobacteria bacterium K_DeepCast_35m_m2_023]|nr:VWA domain-containing protein [Cyanobacteria bacterium K_DeepCast_35m_m2_023]
MPFPSIQLSTRPLHFIYLCDCSGSMAAQGKMQSLNQAIRQSLPSMASVARQNPEATIAVRVIAFSDEARWHLQAPTPVEQVNWQDLNAEGLTAMGAALQLLAGELAGSGMPQHALPPVFVLISDGQPTDDFRAGLGALMAQPWARKAVRLAIAIGQDADLEVLQAFIGEPDVQPMQASNATALAHYIEWASTAVVNSASTPSSSAASGPRMGDVAIPEVPATVFATAKPDSDDFATLTW